MPKQFPWFSPFFVLKSFFLTSCAVTLDAFLLESLLTGCQRGSGSHLAFFQCALLLPRDRQCSQKEGKKKTLHSPNMCILGNFLSCQSARTKPQEEAKMLSKSLKSEQKYHIHSNQKSYGR